MASTCIHGFDPKACLICETLGGSPGATAKTATKTKTSSRAAGSGVQSPAFGQASTSTSTLTAPPALAADRVEGRPAPNKHVLVKLLVTVVALALVALAVYSVLGLALGALHLVELAAAAAGALWVGYRVGHYREARQAKSGGQRR